MHRRPTIILAAIAVLATASCGSDTGPEVGDPLRTAVAIEATGCGPTTRNGMATAIDDRLLVTAAHVVAGAESIEVVGSDGRTAQADVVLFDPLLDVAALRTDTEVASPATIRPERAGPGEQGLIVVVGDDDQLLPVDVTIVRRATIATTDIYLDTDVDRRGFEIDAQIEPGNSGAAVHLPGGAVGIVWARSTRNGQRAWAVDFPAVLVDESTRRALTSVVDTGPCT